MSTEQKYFIKQKLMGLLLVLLGIATMFLLDGDFTFTAFIVPIGLWLIFTRSMAIDGEYEDEFDYYYYDEEEEA